MTTVHTIAAVRDALREPRRQGRVIGLVPTMGALHDGHLALVRQARAECDEVVVSLFVNPTQFNDASDLDRYPRTEERDAQLASEAGANLLFAPPAHEIYPPGFSTSVQIAGPLTESLEGANRGPAHFHGVTTVVTKLFNIVQPDVAYFGRKDAQQGLVIRKLVRDLDLPVRIVLCPTVREPDGLAMSSRNVHLSDGDRRRALGLRRALDAAEATVAGGARSADAISRAARAALAECSIEPEYLAIVDPQTLASVAAVDRDVLVAVAADVGGTRLIDNTLIAANNGRTG
jgi:pantoate--beta-alanine ligase